jgi:hypothetical protein
MVGPGTGLAPFRSFILQRHLQAQQQGSACGQMVLYFGCRRSDQDYLYGGVGAACWGSGWGWRGWVVPRAQSCAAADCQPASSCTSARTAAQLHARLPRQLPRLTRPPAASCPCPCTQDLEAWHAAGTITLFTAFSRMPGQPKVYVQQRLRESADLVWQLLEAGGHFYVSGCCCCCCCCGGGGVLSGCCGPVRLSLATAPCPHSSGSPAVGAPAARAVNARPRALRPQVCGDAGSMAGQVEEALLGIIAQHQGQGADAARQYLEQLSQSERYQRDVWFS